MIKTGSARALLDYAVFNLTRAQREGGECASGLLKPFSGHDTLVTFFSRFRTTEQSYFPFSLFIHDFRPHSLYPILTESRK